MSIIEAFTTNSFVDRVEPLVPQPRIKILKEMYERAEDRAIGSWPEIQSHYKGWFGIGLQQQEFSRWGEVQALIDARNAIVHGVGKLTRRMARRDLTSLRQRFATLDLTLVGGELVVSETALRNAADLAKEFIEWLDLQLRSYDAGGPLPRDPLQGQP